LAALAVLIWRLIRHCLGGSRCTSTSYRQAKGSWPLRFAWSTWRARQDSNPRPAA